MYLSRRWMSNFIDLNDILDEEITKALNSLGFEVDSYKKYEGLNDNLTLGHIGHNQTIEGTKLNFCFVDTGEDMVSTIVCGATNVRGGLYTITAMNGNKIANGLKISNREIKGKKSEGMLCALSEIGMDTNVLSDKELTEIYEISLKEDPYTRIGSKNVLDLIGFNDSIWEVDLTINRSDALAAYQLLKEVANYFKIKIEDFSSNIKPKTDLEKPKFELVQNNENIVNFFAVKKIDVKEVKEIVETELRMYSSEGIWLKFNGIKTTGNFFNDLTNLISIETGCPTLFLDTDKLTESFEIKNVTDKELNKKLFKLYNGKNLISTLGMEVNSDFLPTKKSKSITVVYLGLDNIKMRQQQKNLNVSNPQLQRFMKPISFNFYKLADSRVNYWLDQHSLFSKTSELNILKQPMIDKKIIEVEKKYITQLLGFEIKPKEIINLFKFLNFNIVEKSHSLSFEIDEFRSDINEKADIIEEIARLYGYDNIPEIPPVNLLQFKHKNTDNIIINKIENHLLGKGFNNIKTYSLGNLESETKWNLFNYDNLIELMSPLSNTHNVYRTSLINGAISAASFNSLRGTKNLKLFEIADIYNKKNMRKKHLSILISGDLFSSPTEKINIKSTFNFAKGLSESILKIINPKGNVEFLFNDEINKANNNIHPFLNSEIKIGGELVGFVFKLNPKFEQSKKLVDTFIVEFDLSKLIEISEKTMKVKQISKYQKTSRDISLVFNNELIFNEVIDNILKDVEYITGVNVEDLYKSEELEVQNKYSILLKIWFNAFDKQLSIEDINVQWDKIIKNCNKLKIEIR